MTPKETCRSGAPSQEISNENHSKKPAAVKGVEAVEAVSGELDYSNSLLIFPA